jgi:hypothetical protein
VSEAQAIKSECDGKTKPNVTTNVDSKEQTLNHRHWDLSEKKRDDDIEREHPVTTCMVQMKRFSLKRSIDYREVYIHMGVILNWRMKKRSDVSMMNK